MEANQFSTTTTLSGEAIFNISDTFGSNDDTQTVFQQRSQANLHSMSAADFDRDGDIDLLTGNVGGASAGGTVVASDHRTRGASPRVASEARRYPSAIPANFDHPYGTYG